MKKIFFGLIFALLNFNINSGGMTINILPSFLGCVFILFGLREVEAESSYFSRAKTITIIMTIYSFIVYILDLGGMTASLGIAGMALGGLGIAGFLFLDYLLVKALEDMTVAYHEDLNAHALRTAWTVQALTGVGAYCLIMVELVAGLLMIGYVISSIGFIVSFYRTTKRVQALPNRGMSN